VAFDMLPWTYYLIPVLKVLLRHLAT
jgi:hypothetical protein